MWHYCATCSSESRPTDVRSCTPCIFTDRTTKHCKSCLMSGTCAFATSEYQREKEKDKRREGRRNTRTVIVREMTRWKFAKIAQVAPPRHDRIIRGWWMITKTHHNLTSAWLNDARTMFRVRLIYALFAVALSNLIRGSLVR